MNIYLAAILVEVYREIRNLKCSSQSLCRLLEHQLPDTVSTSHGLIPF